MQQCHVAFKFQAFYKAARTDARILLKRVIFSCPFYEIHRHGKHTFSIVLKEGQMFEGSSSCVDDWTWDICKCEQGMDFSRLRRRRLPSSAIYKSTNTLSFLIITSKKDSALSKTIKSSFIQIRCYLRCCLFKI